MHVRLCPFIDVGVPNTAEPVCLTVFGSPIEASSRLTADVEVIRCKYTFLRCCVTLDICIPKEKMQLLVIREPLKALLLRHHWLAATIYIKLNHSFLVIHYKLTDLLWCTVQGWHIRTRGLLYYLAYSNDKKTVPCGLQYITRIWLRCTQEDCAPPLLPQ